MQQNKAQVEKVLLYVLLGVAILMGIYLRMSLVLRADFPLNDGGLFWTMTQDLIQNGFVLPRYTTYNLAQIPFAYPPGAFYVNGIISQVFHIPLVMLFRWIPLFFSILCLPLVFLIAKLILGSTRMAVLATFAFASIKPSFEWLLMGGGVTRSPAFFFSMMAMLFTITAAKSQKNHRALLASAVSMAVTAYFHLEIALVTALVLTLHYVYYDRNRRLFLFFAYHLLVGLVLLAPYLLALYTHHGISPLRSALTSSSRDFIGSIGLLFVPLYTDESFFPILAVLGALGGLACVANRTYLPLLWLLLTTLVNPRSIHRSAALPEAMLIAMGLETFLFHGLASWIQQTTNNHSLDSLQQKQRGFIDRARYPLFAAAAILTYSFVLASLDLTQSHSTKFLSARERVAFTWVKEHTAPDANFLILPFDAFWEADFVSEWFPALTQRRSVLTVQGNEWLQSNYQEKINAYSALVDCLTSEDRCVQDFQKINPLQYDYILIPMRSENYSPRKVEMQNVLKACILNFQNPDVKIYQCTQK